MCSSTFFFLVLFGERDFLINLERIEYFSRRFGAKSFFFFKLSFLIMGSLFHLLPLLFIIGLYLGSIHCRRYWEGWSAARERTGR